MRGWRGNGLGGGIFFLGGGEVAELRDTSKKPQPERQNNVCGNLPIKIAFLPQDSSSEAFFFALPMKKTEFPKISDTVKPQRKRCFRQEDFGGSERLGRGVWGGVGGRGGAGALGGGTGVQWGVGGGRVGGGGVELCWR